MKRRSIRPQRPPRPDRSAEFATFAPRHNGASKAVMVTSLARASVPIPKPPPCRPGKRAPTVAEKAWMDAIVTLGCIACRMNSYPGVPGEVHHILRAGRRIGHMATICLCPGHHQDGAGVPGLVARHPYKARFEALYGPEDTLLGRTQFLIGMAPNVRAKPQP